MKHAVYLLYMGEFKPDPNLELQKLITAEEALGDGGIIDRHLKWSDREASDSADISDVDYGYQPKSFTTGSAGKRPKLEPLDFTAIATETLGLPYDTPHHELSERVNEVDSGWFEFLVKEEVCSPEQVRALGSAATRAYLLDTLTEDNLPAYVSTALGGFEARAERYGEEIPALQEWSRGIWTAEEGAHGIGMNQYGMMMNMLNSREHQAGRTSQLRSGMEIPFDHVSQLFSYVSWQELSTNYAHKRNGALLGPVGSRLLARVAKDEARHHVVYQGVVERLSEAYPEDTIRTLHATLMKPDMPGKRGIPNFTRRALKIHGSGIFGLEQADDAARSIMKKLNLYDEVAVNLSDDAQRELQELRERYPKDELEPRKRRGEFVLGQTVTIQELASARRDYEKAAGIEQRKLA